MSCLSEAVASVLREGIFVFCRRVSCGVEGGGGWGRSRRGSPSARLLMYPSVGSHDLGDEGARTCSVYLPYILDTTCYGQDRAFVCLL